MGRSTARAEAHERLSPRRDLPAVKPGLDTIASSAESDPRFARGNVSSMGRQLPLLPLIEFPEETLDWQQIFPVARPVQVEVGSGKGRFLIRAAESDHATNWCGL